VTEETAEVFMERAEEELFILIVDIPVGCWLSRGNLHLRQECVLELLLPLVAMTKQFKYGRQFKIT
jgi:hypothetical protein